MDIIIGREKATQPGQKAGRLKLTVNGKSTCVGAYQSVNQYVSGEHCTLTINADGTMTLKNLNMQNVTYVNDQQVNSKRVTFNDKVVLGGAGYVLPWDEIKKLLPKQVDVRHLQKMLDEFNEQMEKLDEEQTRRNKIKAVTGVLSTIAIALGLVLSSIGGFNGGKLAFTLPLYAIVIFANIYYAMKDDIHKQKRELEKKYDEQCTCTCGYPFLPYKQYRRLPSACPGCRAQLIK